MLNFEKNEKKIELKLLVYKFIMKFPLINWFKY